jgi:hypothetical protein
MLHFRRAVIASTPLSLQVGTFLRETVCEPLDHFCKQFIRPLNGASRLVHKCCLNIRPAFVEATETLAKQIEQGMHGGWMHCAI